MRRIPIGTIVAICVAGFLLVYTQYLGSRQINPEMIFKENGMVVYDAGLGHQQYAWSADTGIPDDIVNPLFEDSPRMADIGPDDSLCIEFGPKGSAKTYVVFTIDLRLVPEHEADYYIMAIADDNSGYTHRASEIGLIPMSDGFWSIARTSWGPCPI